MTLPSLGMVLAGAGSSRRMAGMDKIWEMLGDRPVLLHATERFSPLALAIVLVVRAEKVAGAQHLVRHLENVSVVAGGAERQDSVRAGIDVLPAVDVVAVHDVARPFASGKLLLEAVQHVAKGSGVIPALPLSDTIKEVSDDGSVMSTVDRSRLWAAQTPQVFWAETLRTVHRSGTGARGPATDDAALLERCGYPVRVIAGDPRNFKITSEYDLMLARLLVSS